MWLVPALRFPEFTEEWKRIKVSDLLDFYSTNSLSWEQLEYESNEPYNLHYGLIHVGLPTIIDLTKDKLPSIKDGNVPKKYELCKEGDIAFADASEDTNEVAKVVEFYNLDGKKVVCGLHTIHGRNNNGQTAKGFLGYCFSSTVFHNQIRRIAQGTKIYSINTRNFSEVFVGLPSMNEQQKIATLLRLMDERIATQNKIIERLETLIKGIVDSIFTANKFPKVPFKEIYVRAGEGGTPTTSNPEYYDNGTIPFIKIDDLQNKYIKTNKDCITELGLQKSSAWIVPANSIIYSNGATIGAISINLFPVCTKQGILGVVPKADINVEFLYYFMTSTAFTKAVERIVTEGTMRTAYLKDINYIPCPVPCSVKQDEIAKLLSTLSEKLENEVIFQMKLQKQKEFLLSHMFI